MIEQEQVEDLLAASRQQPDNLLRDARRAELLKERSARLASRSPHALAAKKLEKLLVLRIATETWCLRISRAAAVFQTGAIVPVPGADRIIAGLHMWRGNIMTLIDLGALLGVPDNRAKVRNQMAIELRDLSPRAALVIDAIEGTVQLDLEHIEPANGSASGSRFMLGRAQNSLLIIDDDAIAAALLTHGNDNRAD